MRGGKRPNSGRKAGVKTSPRTIKFNRMVTVIENEKLEMYLQELRLKTAVRIKFKCSTVETTFDCPFEQITRDKIRAIYPDKVLIGYCKI